SAGSSRSCATKASPGQSRGASSLPTSRADWRRCNGRMFALVPPRTKCSAGVGSSRAREYTCSTLLCKGLRVNLAAIREKRAAKVAEMRALVAKAEAEKRSLAQPEQATFDALKAEVQDLEGQEARAQFLEDAERRTSGHPVTDRAHDQLQRSVNVVEV